MSLEMRCAHCSVSKIAGEESLAISRIETAHKNGWYAFLHPTLRLTLYFCSTLCKAKYDGHKANKLKVVGSVTR